MESKITIPELQVHTQTCLPSGGILEDTIIVFLDIIHRPIFLLKTQCFGDWKLSPSSGESLLSWTQPTELVPIPGH
jgi:hypothetical protein